mgnify:CR=1 FL=1
MNYERCIEIWVVGLDWEEQTHQRKETESGNGETILQDSPITRYYTPTLQKIQIIPPYLIKFFWRKVEILPSKSWLSSWYYL